MGHLQITPEIALDEDELDERFILAAGPGGQNVNRVASAVQLRFDAARSAALSDAVRVRLKTLAGRRMAKDGVLTIVARRFRSQERNRADARARLADLIERAARAPKTRRKTRVPKASKEQRIADKKLRAARKRERRRPVED